MFRQTSPALVFLFEKNQNISIHSFFCKPFKAIWLDENKKVVKILEIKKWKPHFSAHGKYLLEIPLRREINLFDKKKKHLNTRRC
jgi:uncharacterized membrane protein (UPF0127 family)